MDTAILNNASRLSLWKGTLWGFVQHNSSGRSVLHNHDTYPLFKMSLSSNPTISYPFYLSYNSTAVAELRELSPVYCTVDSRNYSAITVDLYLLSNALYHLGDHSIYIFGAVQSNNSNYWKATILNLRVKAGNVFTKKVCTSNTVYHSIPTLTECDDKAQLYVFSVYDCVSQCPCGYAPFHQHSTAYCEAGM